MQVALLKADLLQSVFCSILPLQQVLIGAVLLGLGTLSKWRSLFNANGDGMIVKDLMPRVPSDDSRTKTVHADIGKRPNLDCRHG